LGLALLESREAPSGTGASSDVAPTDTTESPHRQKGQLALGFSLPAGRRSLAGRLTSRASFRQNSFPAPGWLGSRGDLGRAPGRGVAARARAGPGSAPRAGVALPRDRSEPPRASPNLSWEGAPAPNTKSAISIHLGTHPPRRRHPVSGAPRCLQAHPVSGGKELACQAHLVRAGFARMASFAVEAGSGAAGPGARALARRRRRDPVPVHEGEAGEVAARPMRAAWTRRRGPAAPTAPRPARSPSSAANVSDFVNAVSPRPARALSAGRMSR